MENVNKKKFNSNQKENEDFHMLDWKKWADKYFPVEEKIHNWEPKSRWVLNN